MPMMANKVTNDEPEYFLLSNQFQRLKCYNKHDKSNPGTKNLIREREMEKSKFITHHKPKFPLSL